MLDLIYKWQDLLGAIIGAGVPISFWFFIEWYQRNQKRAEHLMLLQKMLVNAVNNVEDTKRTIEMFRDKKLNVLIKNIDLRTKQNSYSIDTIFFPLLHSETISERVLDVTIQSSYLQNKIVRLVPMSKDFAVTIDDARRQFDSVIDMHKQMLFQKMNPLVGVHNESYKQSMIGFRKFITDEFLNTNLRIYSNHLMISLMAVKLMTQWGFWRWRLIFSPHFCYFISRESLNHWHKNAYDCVEKYVINQLIADPELGRWYRENMKNDPEVDK